jgi:hypothetical protein
MKDREYYERLISDSLDRQLTASEAEELELALRSNPGLAQFRQDLMQQSKAARRLPLLESAKPLRTSQPRAEVAGLWRRLWTRRISIPLPAAASLVLIVLGLGIYGVVSSVSTTRDVMQPVGRVEYVQIERLKPTEARLVDDESVKQSPMEEKP